MGTPILGRYTYTIFGSPALVQTAVIATFTNVIDLAFYTVQDSVDRVFLGTFFSTPSRANSGSIEIDLPACSSGTGKLTLDIDYPSSTVTGLYEVFNPNGDLVATGSLEPPYLVVLDLPPSDFYNIQMILDTPNEPTVFQFNGTPFPAIDNLAFVAGYPTQTNPSCGLSNGKIAVQVVQGSSSYTATAVGSNGVTYTSSPSPFGDNVVSTFSDLPVGTYTGQVLDSGGCSIAFGPIELVDPAGSVDVAIETITAPVCSGGLGSVSFSVVGGIAPYSACLAPATDPTGCTPTPLMGSEGTFEALSGNYVVYVVDSSGCTGNSSVVTIPQSVNNLAFVSGFPTQIDPICGLSTGEIAVQVADGSGSYTATVVDSNGVTYTSSPTPFGDNAVSLFTDLPVEIYTGQVLDNNGCSVAFGPLELVDPAGAVSVTLETIIPPSCSRGLGSVSFTVTGGTVPYSVCLAPVDDPTGCTPMPIVGSEGTLEAPSGSYVLYVVDSNGCTVNSSPFVIPLVPSTGNQIADFIRDKYCCTI